MSAPPSHENTNFAASASAMELSTVSSSRTSSAVLNPYAAAHISTIHDVRLEVKRTLDLVQKILDDAGAVSSNPTSRLAETIKRPLCELWDVESVMEKLVLSILGSSDERSSVFDMQDLGSRLSEVSIPGSADTINRILSDSDKKLKRAKATYEALPTEFSTPNGLVASLASRVRGNLRETGTAIKALYIITSGLGRLGNQLGDTQATILIIASIALEEVHNLIEREISNPGSDYNVYKMAVETVEAFSSAVHSHLALYEDLRSDLYEIVNTPPDNTVDPRIQAKVSHMCDRFNSRVASTPFVHLLEGCRKLLLACERVRSSGGQDDNGQKVIADEEQMRVTAGQRNAVESTPI